ncbi:methyl-accepting chemotaxis protein [Deinococcus aestuarii]|uniref:methyl-accepting chemotaxis protein n=1 Tax=Deinococcus aestuarii TaxID=2774531 RepID=UPI001FE2F6B9|nr:methyl-accepting chemotaxis protein [Deinococcus aestuarii]
MQLQFQTARLSSPARSRGLRAPGGPLANLRVGQKLALTALAFGLPLSVLISLVLADQQRVISVTRGEVNALPLFAPLQDLQGDLGNYTDHLLEGEPDTLQLAARVDRRLQRLETQVPDAARARLAELKRDWTAYQAGGAARSPGALLEELDGLLNVQTRLAQDLLDSSKLSLDSTLPVYHLQNSTLGFLAQLRRSFRVAYLNGEAADPSRALGVLQRETVLARQALASFEDAATRAVRADPDLQGSFGAASTRFVQTAGRLVADMEGAVAQGDLRALNLKALEEQSEEGVRAVQVAGTAGLQRLLSERLAQEQRDRLLSLLGVGAALLAAFGLLIALARSIVGPLGTLTRASQALGGGDLDVRVPVRSRDELGFMASTFNRTAAQLHENEVKTRREREEAQRLQQNIGEFLDVTMDIADGDLTRRGRVTEDVLGNVVDSINLMADELSAVLRSVQAASSSVSGGAQAMLGTTGEIVQGTEATLGEAQRVRAQVQEVTAAIRRMAETAAASATAAGQALSVSVQGQDAVKDTLGGMQNVRREVQDISKRVKALGDRSLEIQEIVDTITRLSSQTNLLALNAAIEAAGAGEAGSRFAIVADEVRKLAENSAQATGRIATLIKTVQGEIQEVVASVEDGTREVESGYRVATTAGERLQELGALARQSAQLAESIRAATTEQVRGVEQVGQAVGEIAQIAERSSVSVQRGRQAAEELQSLAGQLDGSLERFRLPG